MSAHVVLCGANVGARAHRGAPKVMRELASPRPAFASPTASTANALRLLVVASDVSGDLHASDVLTALARLCASHLQVRCVAGPRTVGAADSINGDDTLQHVSTLGLSSIGITHAIPLVSRATRVMRAATDIVETWEPHCVLLIDFPGVNVPLGTSIRRGRSGASPRILYYIPPNEWHVSPARSADVVQSADEVLCVHHREHEHFRSIAQAVDANCDVRFVGHPVAARVAEAASWSQDTACKALRLDSGGVPCTVALLPASRIQETHLVWPAIAKAAHQIFLWHRARRHGFVNDKLKPFGAPPVAKSSGKDVRFLLVVPSGAPPLLEEELRSNAAWFFDAHEAEGRLVVLRGDADEHAHGTVEVAHAAAAASDVALCKTGTVGLELFLLGTPQVSVYALDAFSASLLRLLLHTRNENMDDFLANLPNVIANARVVPELLQEHATPEAIVEEALPFLDGDRRRATDGEDAAKQLRAELASKSAADEVAARIEACFK